MSFVEAAAVTTFLPYGIPAVMLILFYLGLSAYLNSQKQRADADRREHMIKWDSLVKGHESSTMMIVESQTQATNSLVKAHETEISRTIRHHELSTQNLIDSHQKETERAYRMHERNSDAVEILAGQMSKLVEKIDQNQWCPIVREQHDGGKL